MEKHMGRRRFLWTAAGLSLATALAAGIALFRPFPPGAQRPEEPWVAEEILPEEGAEGSAGVDGGPGTLEDAGAKGLWIVTGRVVRGEDRPAGGIAVRLEQAPSEKKQKTYRGRKTATLSSGRFLFERVPGSVEFRLFVDEPSSALRTIAFELEDREGDRRHDLGDIRLEPPVTLAVKLLGPGEKPLESGKVIANPPELPDAPREMMHRGGGEFFLERIVAGEYELTASAPGCRSAVEEVEIPREGPLAIRLQEGRRIAGTVRSLDGTPIEKAELNASEPDSDIPDPTAVTDSSGRFLFDTLDDRTYEIAARAGGFVPDLKLIDAGEEDFEFWLLREAVFAGIVVDEESGSQIREADVHLVYEDDSSADSRWEGATDARGRFEIRKIPPGTYRIFAGHEEYLGADAGPWEVQQGSRIDEIRISLKKGRVIRGKVLDASTGQPIDNALVWLFRVDEGSDGGDAEEEENEETPIEDTQTGKDGTFAFKGLPEGSYKVSASSSVHLPSDPVPVNLSRGDPGDVTISLQKHSTISGRVFGPDGSPLVDADVSLYEPSDRGYTHSNTSSADGDGKYVLGAPRPGTGLVVAAVHNDGAPAMVRGLKVDGVENLEGVDLRLTAGGTVRGRLVSERGEGIQKAYVYVYPDDSDREGEEDREALERIIQRSVRIRHAVTGTDGAFEIRHVLGRYTLRASLGNRPTMYRKGVDVAEGQVVEVPSFVFQFGREVLSGRVVDSGGSPVAGANVGASGAGARTDPDGRFELTELLPGQIELRISGRGFAPRVIEATVPGEEVTVRLERTALLLGRVSAEGRETFPRGRLEASTSPSDGEEDDSRSAEDVETDLTGRFRIELPGGAYRLRAFVSGFAPAEREIVLQSGERREGFTIELLSGGTIEGIAVERGTGSPIEDVEVNIGKILRSAFQGDVDSLGNAATDPDGSFALKNIPEGEFEVVARHDRYLEGTAAAVQVREGETARVKLELSPGGGIRGSVTRGGEPVRRIEVVARGRGNDVSKECSTSNQGLFEIAGLPPGDYLVSANLGNSVSVEERVRIPDARFVEVNLAVEAVRLAGLLTAGGAPLKGAKIFASRPGKGGGQGKSDSSGRYTLELPGGGEYVIGVSRDDAGQARFSVHVPEGVSEFRRDIDLPAGEISGIVVDEGTGKPVRRACVAAFPAAAGASAVFSQSLDAAGRGFTDQEGRFSIPHLPPGNYLLRVFSSEHGPAQVDGIDVGRGKSPEVRVGLSDGHSFRLDVVDERGEQVPATRAILRRGSEPPVLYLEDSPDEVNPEFRKVRPGTYQITIGHRSYAPVRLSLQVPVVGQVPTITLRPGGDLRVEVVDRDGRPVEGAAVAVRDAGGADVAPEACFFSGDVEMTAWGCSILPVRTSADGSLTLGPLSPGSYRASAVLGGARSREETVAIARGRTSEVRLRISEQDLRGSP